MNEEINCGYCRFWLKVENQRYGQCRRNAPKDSLRENTGYMALWFQTWNHDWCGEFERKD